MALTHHSGLAVSGTVTLSGAVVATGSGKTLYATRLAVSGTTTLSGAVTATASGKTLSATRLAVTGTTTLSGAVTATGSGKTLSATRLAASGTTTLSGVLTATGLGKKTSLRDLSVVGTGSKGTKVIATAGSGNVATDKVHTTSVILLTCQKLPTNKQLTVGTITAGTGFKIWCRNFVTGTGVTGPAAGVNWMILNQS